MPAPRRHHWFSLEDYLEFELAHEARFEYVDGAIVAIAGGLSTAARDRAIPASSA